MSIPSAAIYMLGYEHLLTIISPYFTRSLDKSANLSSINRPAGIIVDETQSSPSPSLTPAPLIAGSLARTFSATVISPIEMFRTRLQALPSGEDCLGSVIGLYAVVPLLTAVAERGTPTYASTAKEMAHMVNTKGVTILWRGLGPTLWRDVPFSGECGAAGAGHPPLLPILDCINFHLAPNSFPRVTPRAPS